MHAQGDPSTETALLRVGINTERAAEDGGYSVLVTLDVTAEFISVRFDTKIRRADIDV
jgi:hypothetical protein